MKRVWSLLEEVRPKVDDYIKSHLSGYRFSDEAIYHMESGGKRWRPA